MNLIRGITQEVGRKFAITAIVVTAVGLYTVAMTVAGVSIIVDEAKKRVGIK